MQMPKSGFERPHHLGNPTHPAQLGLRRVLRQSSRAHPPAPSPGRPLHMVLSRLLLIFLLLPRDGDLPENVDYALFTSVSLGQS